MSCNKCNLSPCNCYASVPNVSCTAQLPCTPCVSPVYTTPSGLYFSRTSTVNLELFAMPIVPKILIAAPGPNRLIVPIQIWNTIIPSNPAIPYQDAGANTPQLMFNLGSFAIASDSSILGALTEQTTYYTSLSGTLAGNLANQPLTISTLTQPVVGNSVLYSYIIFTIVNV